MVFSKEEVKWIKLVTRDHLKYRISVDNDCISIDKLIDENTNEWESVFVFNNYGQDLIVQLFNYIGCDADCV